MRHNSRASLDPFIARFEYSSLTATTMGSIAARCGIITDNRGSLISSTTLPEPRCSPHGVLVRVHAVALNPVDVKMPRAIAREGLVAGNDFAGEIVEIGSEVHLINRPGCPAWKVGDRVCGAVLGCNPRKPTTGSFADLIEADPVTMARLPDHWGWEEGTALGGCCVGAVGLGLFRNLNLKLDTAAAEKRGVVLVYGGSTACGTAALQLLKL